MNTIPNNKLSTGKITVPAASFNQSNDPNVQPSPINVTIGGIPQHWLATAPLSKRDMKTGTTPLGEKAKVKVLRFNEYLNSK
jgi:hypothetical protein